MTKEKIVQTIIRTTENEKKIIVNKAKNSNLSINEYIKKILLSDDIKSDNNNDIIELLKEQLKTKDEQILHLQQIIFLKEKNEVKLIEEHSKTKSSWWKFWAKD